MSGGSFNYLCNIYEPALLVQRRQDLQDMADELAQFPDADDAAHETQRLLADLRAFEVRTEVALERLRDIWKAVEWWRSCDSGPERVTEALQRYRGLC